MDNTHQETDTISDLCLPLDLDILEYFNNCLVGITWSPEDTDSLQEKLVAEGFWDLEIKGITKRKFMIKCDKNDHERLIEDSNLNTWFKEVRAFENEDKLIPRKVWIQIAGIPLTSISCSNVQII